MEIDPAPLGRFFEERMCMFCGEPTTHAQAANGALSFFAPLVAAVLVRLRRRRANARRAPSEQGVDKRN